MDKSCVHHQESLCVSSELSIPDPSVASIFALASDLPCILFSEGNPASYGSRKKGDGCIPHQSDSSALNSLLPLVSVPGSSWIAAIQSVYIVSLHSALDARALSWLASLPLSVDQPGLFFKPVYFYLQLPHFPIQSVSLSFDPFRLPVLATLPAAGRG